jgi:hypothetical protein
MIWILIGLALGVAIGVGRLAEIGAVFDSLVVTLVAYVDGLLQSAVAVLTEAMPFTGPLEVLALALSVTAPGWLVALLVVLIRAGELGRKVVAAVLVVAAALSFAVLPLFAAVTLVVVALVVAGASRLLSGPALTTPLVTLGTLTAYRYTALMIDAEDPVLTVAAAKLVLLIPGLEPSLAEIALAFLAIAPFFAAGAALLRSEGRS